MLYYLGSYMAVSLGLTSIVVQMLGCLMAIVRNRNTYNPNPKPLNPQARKP